MDINEKILKRTASFQEHLIEALKDKDVAVGYLNESLEDEHYELFLMALKNVAEAQGGLSKIAKRAKLDRAGLYRILSKKGNPEIQSLESILKAFGMRLAIVKDTNSSNRKAA